MHVDCTNLIRRHIHSFNNFKEVQVKTSLYFFISNIATFRSGEEYVVTQSTNRTKIRRYYTVLTVAKTTNTAEYLRIVSGITFDVTE